MRTTRTLAAAALATMLALGACGGDEPATRTTTPADQTTTTIGTRSGLVGQVDRTRDVATGLEDRNASLENRAP